jgi:nucleotide-binding universal stress UspA family protein
MAVPIIKRVLTATDLSDSANQALDYAGFFAKTFSVPLDILHVTELLPDMDAADVEADVYFTERRKMAQGSLEELVEHSAAAGVVTRFKHRLGIPSQEITKTAAECGVDLIVLGSQGRSGLADIALGSTADRVVRGASCPVVTVRALPEYGRCTGDRSKKTPPAIHHILAPVDFSKCSLEALDYAALLAAQFRADLTVVHVLQPIYYNLELGSGQVMDEPAKRERAEERLTDLAGRLAPAGVTVKTHIRGGVACDSILAAASHITADLIVMGTHGRRTWTKSYSGSVAEAVLRQAPCPVLTLRSLPAGDYPRLVSALESTGSNGST